MAEPKTKEELVELLRRSVVEWNAWRKEHPDTRLDLSGVDLIEADLSGADLSRVFLLGADLTKADLTGANLEGADLTEVDLAARNLAKANLTKARLIKANLYRANLTGAILKEAHLIGANLMNAILTGAHLEGTDLMGANLHGATLNEADLTKAYLMGANLSGANFTGAILKEANLKGALLLETNLERANLTGCRIYGISAWDLKLEGTIQNELIITPPGEPEITVGDLEVAQFIYLMVFNPKIRKVIDTITSKVVLILGRFTQERKAVLDAVRGELQRHDLVPVIFDFEAPKSRDLTETVRTLAHLARFIVADITDPKSIPQELTTIIPGLPSVPVQTVILASEREYGMYENWKRYPWVLPMFRYDNVRHLLASIDEKVIGPAEERRSRGL